MSGGGKPLDERSTEELKAKLAQGKFGARRRKFAEEVLRRRYGGRSTGVSVRFWVAALATLGLGRALLRRWLGAK